MKLSITALKTDRHWRSATGLDQKRFAKLLIWVEKAYQQIHGKPIEERQAECPEEPALSTYTDLLLFTLFSFKSGLSYDLLGFTTGMDGSSAKRNQDIGMAVLKQALVDSGHAPKRSFASVEEFKAYFYQKGKILIDATEQRTAPAARPKAGRFGLPKADVQWKKKAHTVKTMILSTTDRYIHFLSKCWVGKSHDYTQLKTEFPADQPWFKDQSLGVDLGYLGIVKDYDCEQVSIPAKKPKGDELTDGKRAENRVKSSERIYVEHAIGGMKRFRYLSDRLRTHKVDLYESAIGMCAGLWNFYLTN